MHAKGIRPSGWISRCRFRRRAPTPSPRCCAPFMRSTSRAATVVDISGSGPTLDLERSASGAHLQSTDRRSTTSSSRLAGQQVRASEHDRCLAVEALEPGQPLHLRACSDARLQRWRFADGRLSPASRPELCVALAAVRGEPWGTPRLVSPAYRRQSLALAACDEAAAARQTFRWLTPAELAPSTADEARSRHAARARHGPCRIRPRVRRRDRAADRGALRAAAARLRASRNRRRPRTWPTARTSASASTFTRARAAPRSPCPRSSSSTAAGSSAAAAARRRTSPSTSRAWATSASTAAIAWRPMRNGPRAPATSRPQSAICASTSPSTAAIPSASTWPASRRARCTPRPTCSVPSYCRPTRREPRARSSCRAPTRSTSRPPGAASSRTSARTARAGRRWS